MKKIPNYGLNYSKPRKILKIWCDFVTKPLKNGNFLSKKSLDMGTYFGKNYPCRWHIPDQSKSEYPPGVTGQLWLSGGGGEGEGIKESVGDWG